MIPNVRPREGILASTTFPALIFSILGRRETGVLTFTGETSEKSVYIQSGSPVFATSSDRDDRLGQVLFKAGLVSLEALMQSLDEAVCGGKRLGAVLVERGLIQPHDLVEGVRAQVRNIVCSLFSWTRGRYSYLAGPLPTTEVITLKLSAPTMILEGIRRIESWERIWEAVGGLDTEYRTTERLEEVTGDLDLSLEEWTLLSHCDRPAPLRELCQVSTMKDFDICRLLWAMLTLGALVRGSPLLN